MKRYLLLISLLALSTGMFAQPQEEPTKFSRSALSMVLCENDLSDVETTPEDRELIRTVFKKYMEEHFPVKYDFHPLKTDFFTESWFRSLGYSYKQEDLDQKALQYLEFLKKRSKSPDKEVIDHTKDPVGNALILAGAPPIEVRDSVYWRKRYEETHNAWIAHFHFNEALNSKLGLGKQAVATWFNYDGNKKADGSYFDMNLIKERGVYNASEIDKMNAEGSSRSAKEILAESGEFLINNSFVAVVGFGITRNESKAKALQTTILDIANGDPILTSLANRLYESTKDGLTVYAGVNLYKLEWSDSLSNVMYTEYWQDKDAFENSNLFRLTKVGSQSCKGVVNGSAGLSEETILTLAMCRSLNKVFYNLQKEYESFRPIVPLMQSDPYMCVDAGIKEGLSPKGGERFEKIKVELDENGKYIYKKSGVSLTTDKKFIYNNILDQIEYNYSPENSFVEKVYDKQTKTLVDKTFNYITSTQYNNGKKIEGVDFVDVLNPQDKSQAAELASISKIMGKLGIEYDSNLVLKYTSDFDSTTAYYVNSNGKWMIVPQIGPDGNILKGTVVNGTKLPAGTLLRQASFNK